MCFSLLTQSLVKTTAFLYPSALFLNLFFDAYFLPESIVKSVILYPNTAFHLNEYLDRLTTSDIHCRIHCACCAPQRHLAGFDIPLCQLPSFREKDVVALGRAVLPTWSRLSEKRILAKESARQHLATQAKGTGVTNLECSYIVVRNQNSHLKQFLHSQSLCLLQTHFFFQKRGAVFHLLIYKFYIQLLFSTGGQDRFHQLQSRS